MIFPTHCRFVGVVSKHHRPDYRPDDAIYFSSQYLLIFDAPDRCAVYEVAGEGEGFIRRSRDVKKIAGAEQTLVYAGQVDITNRADLIRKAAALCRDGIDTVVFQGIDRHYTFVHEPTTEGLRVVEVYDVAPPWPAWLEHNVRRLDEAGMFGDLLLTFDYHTLDLKAFEDPARTTIFPCHASGLNGLFLDSLDEEPRGDIRLVGCNTSKRVFDARFPMKRYEHVNICPLSTRKPRKPFVLRCCQSDKLGPTTSGDGVPGIVVHWGASPRDISEAVRQLAGAIGERSPMPGR